MDEVRERIDRPRQASREGGSVGFQVVLDESEGSLSDSAFIFKQSQGGRSIIVFFFQRLTAYGGAGGLSYGVSIGSFKVAYEDARN